MTTIACDGKTIVTDSQSTDANSINCGYQQKVHKIDGVGCFASCGTVEDAILVREWIAGGAIKKEMPEVGDGFSAILMMGNGSVHLYGKKLVPMQVSTPTFLGSGYELAMGAYEVCGDLAESVRVAIKFDTNSGGDLQILSIIDIKEGN